MQATGVEQTGMISVLWGTAILLVTLVLALGVKQVVERVLLRRLAEGRTRATISNLVFGSMWGVLVYYCSSYIGMLQLVVFLILTAIELIVVLAITERVTALLTRLMLQHLRPDTLRTLIHDSLHIGSFVLLLYGFNIYVGQISRTSTAEFIVPEMSILTEPNVMFASRVRYHLFRPRRGEIVSIRGELDAQLTPNWRADVPSPYHFLKSSRGESYMAYLRHVVGLPDPEKQVRRVVGLPYESIEMVGGQIRINGVILNEPYVARFGSSAHRLELQLGASEYLLARDTRTDQALGEEHTLVIVHEQQIVTRELFVFWPLRRLGFVVRPTYNIPDPPVLRIPFDNPWVQTLINM